MNLVDHLGCPHRKLDLGLEVSDRDFEVRNQLLQLVLHIYFILIKDPN